MDEPLLSRFRRLGRLWRGIAGRAKGEALALAPGLPDGDLERLRGQMRACLEGRGGEVTARARAAALGRAYIGLPAQGRARFLGLLAQEFGPEREAVDRAVETLRQAAPQQRAAAERALREALEPPRLRLLTQFNALPEGVKFLVDLRADLIELSRAEPALAEVERDLKGLLGQWFDVDFLELRRLTWRSPAVVLEKIMAYEAVHAIQGWEDLKNRLDSDRRLYAFFHPRMQDEPLIFVEVALVEGMAGDVRELLDPQAPVGDPGAADAAIFYSITNAQKGLAGISFGGFLIKRVVDLLSAEFGRLGTFATLSPMPGFRAWLEGLPDDEAGIAAALAGERPGDALKTPLMRLAARYLAEEKRGAAANRDSRALDPVAHFHLSNGARIERINWLADTSEKGMAQSLGMMVNYLYRPSDIEDNHEAYAGAGKVAMSGTVRALLKG